MALALKGLETDGLSFNMTYSRGPFFLRGSQDDIDQWYASMGLPNDAPRWKVAEVKMAAGKPFNDASIDALFEESGLSPRNIEGTDSKVWTETMTAHRLAQYAATQSSEQSELLWEALSRRFFGGKDTKLRPIKLNNHEMLLECAEHAGLDLGEVGSVLCGDEFSHDVQRMVKQVHSAGIHSIPVLVFEVEGLAQGSWLSGARSPFRALHHGSGNKKAFQDILLQLHAACAT